MTFTKQKLIKHLKVKIPFTFLTFAISNIPSHILEDEIAIYEAIDHIIHSRNKLVEDIRDRIHLLYGNQIIELKEILSNNETSEMICKEVAEAMEVFFSILC